MDEIIVIVDIHGNRVSVSRSVAIQAIGSRLDDGDCFLVQRVKEPSRWVKVTLEVNPDFAEATSIVVEASPS